MHKLTNTQEIFAEAIAAGRVGQTPTVQPLLQRSEARITS
jgi:hypothetical protein